MSKRSSHIGRHEPRVEFYAPAQAVARLGNAHFDLSHRHPNRAYGQIAVPHHCRTTTKQAHVAVLGEQFLQRGLNRRLDHIPGPAPDQLLQREPHLAYIADRLAGILAHGVSPWLLTSNLINPISAEVRHLLNLLRRAAHTLVSTIAGSCCVKEELECSIS